MTSTTRHLLLLLAASSLAACSFDTAGVYFPEEGDDEPGPDAGSESPNDDPIDQIAPDSGCAEWSARHFDPCALPHPSSGLDLQTAGTYLYDTDTGVLTDPLGGTQNPPSVLLAQSSGPDARVLSIADLTVGEQAALRVVGSAPLIVASWSTIDVLGSIDASSRSDESRGAGSNPEACQSHAPSDGGDSIFSGGGGGGGAGFGSGGGLGGNGGIVAGGAGGVGVALPAGVRGGCAGASGGAGRTYGGDGGNGGGVVYLVARREIAVHGVVLANGSGGHRGDRAIFGSGLGHDENSSGGGGGGGGGSGGMVGLEAPTVVLGPSAIVTANGGGAGEGGDVDNGGAPGSDGLAAVQEAPGGAGFALQGGDGGAGGFDLDPSGTNGVLAILGGGGGGGGGVGFVVLDADDWLIPVSAIVTPSPVQP